MKPKTSTSKTPAIELQSPGWTPGARSALQRLIRNGSGKGLPVVFDFDNTIVSGDIGEAVLAQLVKSGRLQISAIPESLAPPFLHPDSGLVTLKGCVDVTHYYEKFLSPTWHGRDDQTPLANGYVWAVEVLEGLSPWEVVEATRAALAAGIPGKRSLIEASNGATAYPAPFFHPQMVELIGELLRHKFDFWVVSASNVWSVRCMVLEGLNKALKALGYKDLVRKDRIVGVSTLLVDEKGAFCKDPVLARKLPGYATLDPKALKGFRLTSRLNFPVPSYSGKVACIFDSIGCPPHLCAGDSPGDLPMLRYSTHRLWLARLEKPGYQEALTGLPENILQKGWIIQPTIAGDQPGFVPDPAGLCGKSASHKKSLKILGRLSKIQGA